MRIKKYCFRRRDYRDNLPDSRFKRTVCSFALVRLHYRRSGGRFACLCISYDSKSSENRSPVPFLLLRQAANRIAQTILRYGLKLHQEMRIGELAVSFNKMAEHLQRTTVSKDYVDNIIKSMAESLIVTAPDGAITTVNQVACELLATVNMNLPANRFRDIER